MIHLRQSTASQEVPLGHFVDDADGKTAETGLTIANTDIKVWKTGATTLANKNSGGATHISGGVYYCVLDATDTDTIGPLVLFVAVSGALAVRLECCVLDEAVYDVQFGTTAPATVSNITGGTITTVTNLTNAPTNGDLTTTMKASINAEADTALSDYGALKPTTAGRTLDVSVGGEAGLDWANVGSSTTTLALTGTTIATTQKVDIETIKTNPVANGGTVTFPTNATLASTTNITDGLMRLADGVHGGTTAVLTLERMVIAATTANEPAIKATGNGTGAGVRLTGGATGHGVTITGGSTSGDGMNVTGGPSGNGLKLTGTGSGSGLFAAGGATNANGIRVSGTGTAAGIDSAGGSTSGPGIKSAGGGSGAGIRSSGGSTGDAFQIIGGSTSGNGLTVTTTSGHAISATATGSSMHGMVLTGGNGGTSDGFKCVAGTGGVDLRANRTGNLIGTVDTLTTYIGNTPQTGDTFARIGAAGAGLTAIGDTRIANLDATVSSRSTYAGGDTAGTTTLLTRVTAAVALAGSAPSWYSSPVDVSANVTAIKAKTDLIPMAPAAVGDIPTTGMIVTALLSDGGGGYFSGQLGHYLFVAIPDGVTAIKAKTDLLTFDPLNNLAAYLADGVVHGGSTATLRLGSSGATPSLYVTNDGFGDAVRFDASGGLTGRGLAALGGPGADGVVFSGGHDALSCISTVSGRGVFVQAHGNEKEGMRIESGSPNAEGITIVATGTGIGFHISTESGQSVATETTANIAAGWGASVVGNARTRDMYLQGYVNKVTQSADGLTLTLYSYDDSTVLQTITETRLATTVGGVKNLTPT